MGDSGNPIAINTYGKYGIPGSTNSGRFQYTGQAFIAETGMYYYKNRMYSPTIGRFLQADPIGYGDGMNWYAYTHNDPVNGSDPLGLGTTPSQLALPYVWCITNCNSVGGPIVTGSRVWNSGLSNPLDGGGARINCLSGGCDLSGLDNVDADSLPGVGQGRGTPNASDRRIPNAADRCQSNESGWAKLAESAGKWSFRAGVVGNVAGLGALATSETGVGGLVLGGVALGAEVASYGLTAVSVVAQWEDGNHGGAVATAIGGAVGFGVSRGLPRIYTRPNIAGKAAEKFNEVMGGVAGDRAGEVASFTACHI